MVGWLVGECSWIHKIRRWFLFHGGSGPLVILLKIPELSCFPESLLSRFLHCPVQGFPDQSIILCDPGQWPLDLPSSQETKNASIVVGASEKGGFEGYIVLYQQRPRTALDAYFATSFSISLSIVLALLDLCPSRKACRCLKCFLAGPCPMEMPVPVQRNNACPPADSVPTFQNLKHALARTPLDITHPIPIHLDIQRPGWFLFSFSVIFSFFYRPPTPFLSCNAKCVENDL